MGASNVFVEVRLRVATTLPTANIGVITRLSGSSGFMCDALVSSQESRVLLQHDVSNNSAGAASTSSSMATFDDGSPVVLQAMVSGSLSRCTGTAQGLTSTNDRTVGTFGTDVALRFRRISAAIDSVAIYALD